MRERALTLTLEDCEEDGPLFADVVAALRVAAALLDMRFKYLKVVPWNFSNADTPAGAASFLAGATALPFEQQDALTQFLYSTHRDALEALAAGGACASSLSDEVSVVNDTPLDESAGEGYHRSTNCTRIRARAAKSAYIKQSTRTSQNYGQLKALLRMGEQGKHVLRYEWRNWSRVLQAKRWFWRKKHMQSQKVFEAIYHEDDKSEECWASVASPQPAPGQGIGSTDPTSVDALRIEYLLDVLKPRRWYQVELPVAGLDEHGRPERRRVLQHFQVVTMSSVKSRPHIMPTVETHMDPVVVKRLAIHIQEASVRAVPGLGEGSIVVYPDADPRWIGYEDIGPWSPVRDTLSIFLDVQGVQEHAGCLQLSNVQLARPVHPLTDMKCPTLCILAELYRRGWKAVRGRQTHASIAIGPMDGREAIKMKSYYIVLVEIEKCFPLSTSIPSDQPIAYYLCLLAGHSVEPGLGAVEYQRILRGREYVAPPPAIEDDDEVSILSYIMKHEILSARVDVNVDMLMEAFRCVHIIVPNQLTGRCGHQEIVELFFVMTM